MNNIKPRTREEREAMRDKDILEKTRINQRLIIISIEGFEQKNLNVKDLLFNSNPNSTLYCPGLIIYKNQIFNFVMLENQRFDKDYAQFHHEQKQQKLLQKEVAMEYKRFELLDKELNKWEEEEKKEMVNEQKRKYQQEVLLAAKRNSNGIPYNPITLQYAQTKEGEQLKKRDENAQVRAYVRSHNLDSRSNCGYNLITGEKRQAIIIPNKFQKDYEQKLEANQQYYKFQLQKSDPQQFYMSQEQMDEYVNQQLNKDKFPLPQNNQQELLQITETQNQQSRQKTPIQVPLEEQNEKQKSQRVSNQQTPINKQSDTLINLPQKLEQSSQHDFPIKNSKNNSIEQTPLNQSQMSQKQLQNKQQTPINRSSHISQQELSQYHQNENKTPQSQQQEQRSIKSMGISSQSNRQATGYHPIKIQNNIF